MKKICFALTLLLCCGSAFAFDFDPIGTVKKAFGSVAGEKGSGITAGFSRDDRLEVVKDDIYRLMWQDQQFMGISVPPLIVTVGNKYKEMTYDEAVEYCENLNFAGFDDWRLPTINELLSITDDTRFKPAINKAFENVAYKIYNKGKIYDKGEKSYGWYWSSTRSADDSSNAWIVHFKNGDDKPYLVSNSSFVRCVRDY